MFVRFQNKICFVVDSIYLYSKAQQNTENYMSETSQNINILVDCNDIQNNETFAAYPNECIEVDIKLNPGVYTDLTDFIHNQIQAKKAYTKREDLWKIIYISVAGKKKAYTIKSVDKIYNEGMFCTLYNDEDQPRNFKFNGVFTEYIFNNY